jgi:hypothetical protein
MLRELLEARVVDDEQIGREVAAQGAVALRERFEPVQLPLSNFASQCRRGRRWNCLLAASGVTGFRVLALKDGPSVRLLSRNYKDLTRRFPSVVDAVARVNARSAIRAAGAKPRRSPTTPSTCYTAMGKTCGSCRWRTGNARWRARRGRLGRAGARVAGNVADREMLVVGACRGATRADPEGIHRVSQTSGGCLHPLARLGSNAWIVPQRE